MNSIESNFVPYQIALDMKSIGFDEPCVAFYYGQLNRLEIGFNWLNEGCKNSLLEEITSAPLYQQTFRWFRDKHDLPSEVRFVANLEVYDYRITKIGVGYTNSFYDGVRPTSAFKSYEEAELECLKKLIEIINENNYRKIN